MMGGGGSGSGVLGSWGRSAWDFATGGGDDSRRERRERRRQDEIDRAERLNERLTQIQNQLEAELERDEYEEIEHIRELARLFRELVRIQDDLNRARRLR